MALSRSTEIKEEIRSLPAVRQLPDPGTQIQNWAKIGHCRPKHHYMPTTYSEVQAIIRRLYKERGSRVTVRGAGMAPNGLFYTDHHMIHTDALNRVIEVNVDHLTARCQAGCTLRDLQDALTAHNLQLPVLPSVLSLTVGGSVAVSAHGSSIHATTLSGYVIEAVLVNGLGELLTISEKSNAEYFPAVRANLGVLGVVVELTMRVERRASYHSVTSPIALEDVAKVLSQRVMMSHSYRLWYYPHTEMCAENVIQRIPPADELRDDAASTARASVKTTMSRVSVSPKAMGRRMEFVVRTVDRHDRENDAGWSTWEQNQKKLTTKLASHLRGSWLRHNVVEAAMMTTTKAPVLQPLLNKAFFSVFCNHKEEVYGDITAVMTMDCLFSQHALEFAVPVERTMEALQLARSIIIDGKLKGIHFPIEVRFCDGDDAWMSPAYQRKTCYIGLVQYRPYAKYESPDTEAYYSRFAQAVKKLGGRPHLAKYCEQWNDAAMGAAFPRWGEFKSVQRKLDPHGMFVNEWYHRRSHL